MPIHSNPLHSRDDFAQLLRDLVLPLGRFASPGGALVKLGEDGASFNLRAQELEGFARPLWGLAPLHAGGGAYEGWERFQRGLASGSDPAHPEYWGPVGHNDQRAVEMAAIGYGLALAPEVLWDPLPAAVQARLGAWLAQVQSVRMNGNNWHFFPVIAGLGLERVGVAVDARSRQRHLARIDSFYLGQGWYGDGAGHIDHYNGFAFHFYGLLHAHLAQGDDPRPAQRFRERATEFAQTYVHWFGDDGACLAMGRSLCYRFATAAFWGALAFAGVQALPWGQLRGLWARQIRWWMHKPVLDAAGLLSVGYGWPNALMGEQYNSSASPYWALKAFLPLALPAGHPFWSAAEEPHPGLAQPQTVRPAAMLVGRWEGDAIVLPAAPTPGKLRGGGDKYAKFAYTSRFGMSVEAARWIGMGFCGDNILALSEDGETYHAREKLLQARVGKGWIETRWSPLKGVEVTSLQLLHAGWEVRLHRIESQLALKSIESGHAVADAAAGCEGEGARSVIVDLLGSRQARSMPVMPNTHLLHARARVPVLAGAFGPGSIGLATAVRASAGAGPLLKAPVAELLKAARGAVRIAGWPDLTGPAGDLPAS